MTTILTLRLLLKRVTCERVYLVLRLHMFYNSRHLCSSTHSFCAFIVSFRCVYTDRRLMPVFTNAMPK
uniref:Secreted protein n=1 Tax=Pararge aegeria TaxID=116150 RepID=S4NZ82_9NEOP